MDIQGKVMKQPIAAGSKSERDAILIVTADSQWILRRIGGNPFADPVLEKLVGKSIRGQGAIHGQTFMMNAWSEIEETE